jgi:kynurenine formamidase
MEEDEMTARTVDLSYRLDPTTPVFQDYPPVQIQVLESTRYTRPDGRRALNSSRVSIGIHCGTHMDAPFHFFEDGRTVDQIPLHQCVGPALLIDLGNALGDGQIKTHHLSSYRDKLRDLRKVIFQTGWSDQWGRPEYFTNHPVIAPEAGQLLVESGVHLVGVDMPSVDRPPFPVHLALLGSGSIIIENLTNLSGIQTKTFQLVVLPLKITGRDGSPVRAIAMELL